MSPTLEAPDVGLKVRAPDPRVPTAKHAPPEGAKEVWSFSLLHLTLLGLGVLTLIIALPVSDAVVLLADPDYVFWAGRAMPTWLIMALVAVLLVFFVSAQGNAQNIAVHSLITLTTTFLTTIGIILVFGSLYLYYKNMVVSQALTFGCESNPITSDLRRSYMSLLTLRETASCSTLQSVAECPGYQQAAPLEDSNYLRYLEEQMHCSGFCQMSGSNASFIEVEGQRRVLSKGRSTPAGFLGVAAISENAADTSKSLSSHRSAVLPPALFSKTTSQITCDGAAARNIGYAGDRIAATWWNSAVVLITLSALLGLAECCVSAKSVRS
jgi:hypothetical protein